jgi:hypothetical protein
MSKIGELKVRFLSFSLLQTSRGAFLLAESALFTLPSLLFAAEEGGIPARHCFFFSLYTLCHRADLFFVLSPQLFSSSARAPGPAEPRTSTRRPPLSSNVLVGARRIDSRPRPQVGTRRALMPNLPSTLASPRGPKLLQAATEACNIGGAKSSRHIGEPRRRARADS